MNSDHQFSWRRHIAFDSMNAHSQADDPALAHVMQFNTDERELARRFAQLETRLEKRLTEHDQAIAAILSANRELMNPPVPQRLSGFPLAYA